MHGAKENESQSEDTILLMKTNVEKIWGDKIDFVIYEQ